MEADQPQAQAIAIQCENILATGTDEEILPLQAPETQIVDLAGRTVLPGFIDGHTHVLRFPDRAGTTLDEAIEVALTYGLTTVNEMVADDPFLDQLMAAEREGRLRLRVNVFPEYNAGIVDDEGNTIYMGVWFPEQGPILAPGNDQHHNCQPNLGHLWEAAPHVEVCRLVGVERVVDLYLLAELLAYVLEGRQAGHHDIAFLSIAQCRHHEFSIKGTPENGVVARYVAPHSKQSWRKHLERSTAEAP